MIQCFGDVAIDPKDVIVVARRFDSNSSSDQSTLVLRDREDRAVVIQISPAEADALLGHFGKRDKANDSDDLGDEYDHFYGPCDFVQTSPCGRGQCHPHGLIGRLWRIKDPKSVCVGNCFMSGRLKTGDLWLGIAHSGDCFQTYMFVEEYANCLIGRPELTFGSYGIGDSTPVQLTSGEFETLESGGRVERKISTNDDVDRAAPSQPNHVDGP